MNIQSQISVRTNGARPPVLIQGGSYRVDVRPNRAQLETFRCAIRTYKELMERGPDYRTEGAVRLGCIVNDLGIAPKERPKATGNFSLPLEHARLLLESKIDVDKVLIFWESTLRNGAEYDRTRKGITIQRTEGGSPRCVSIMGKFYKLLERMGFSSQIGFYEGRTEAAPPDYRGVVDRSCVYGPVEGAIVSGYEIKIEVLNAILRTKTNGETYELEWHHIKPESKKT